MKPLLAQATDTACLWIDYMQLAADTQTVVAMRLLGLGGAWKTPKTETQEMLAEKAPVFAEAIVAGTLSAMSGQRPDQIGRAALEPLSQAARQNRQRLSQLGPKLPVAFRGPTPEHNGAKR